MTSAFDELKSLRHTALEKSNIGSKSIASMVSVPLGIDSFSLIGGNSLNSTSIAFLTNVSQAGVD